MSTRDRHGITMADVAKEAQVDRSVVSRALSGDPALNIRESTREKILRAASELGYRPNVAARSLKTARAATFGLLIPDFANPIYAEIIKGAEAGASSHESLLFTGSLSDLGRGHGHYLDLLGQGRIDGLLFAGSTRVSKLEERLERLGIPWLVVNNRTTEVHRYILLDDEGASRLAVEHLINLGHQHIAHFSGPPGVDSVNRRLAGYLGALEARGLKSHPSLVFEASYDSEGGQRAMETFLAANVEERPTAIFVGNVAAAIGVLACARRAGLSIPEELSVVAVHDLPLADYLYPPLTTVRTPLVELGRRGIELLASVPATQPVKEIVGGETRLIVRESTAPPAR